MSSTPIPLRPLRPQATAVRRGHMPVGPANRRARATNGADVAAVYERIWTAIIDHSLPPETRLVEKRLCEIFGLRRTRLRQVLQRPPPGRVVTLMPNRRATGSQTPVREGRGAFAA